MKSYLGHGRCWKCGEQIIKTYYVSGKVAPGGYDETNQQVEIAAGWNNGTAVRVRGNVLVVHVCKQEDIDRHQDYLDHWSQWAADRNVFLKAAWKDAKSRSCPKCSATKGGPCLDQRKGYEGRHTIWPHTPRLSDSFLEMQEKINQEKAKAAKHARNARQSGRRGVH